MWIFIALLNPVLHAFANILDNYLVNRLFERKTTLMFYATFLNILFLPLLFLFTGLPALPTGSSFLIFLGLALINVVYLYPYYKALEKNDTSSVIALFSLGQVFVPILAFLVVGERLAPVQYAGVGIIVVASLMLNLEKGTRLKLNGSFWWMVLCTLILSFEYVLYKLAFVSVNWITGFSWPVMLSFLFAIPLLLLPATGRHIIANWPRFKQKFHVFATEEFLTFAGIAAGTYAVSVAPVTLVKAATSTEPAFVLLYAALFSSAYPKVFKEKVSARSITIKLFLFAVIAAGIALAIGLFKVS